MKKILALALATVTILGSTCVYAEDGATRYVFNGDETSVSTVAIVKNDVLFLPAKDVFCLSQNKVIEKTSNNSLTIESLGKPGYVSVWVGKTKARENGQNITVSIAPFKENGIVYVPVKFVEEQMGAKISYDTEKNTIYIDSEDEGLITSTYRVKSVKTPDRMVDYSVLIGTSGTLSSDGTHYTYKTNPYNEAGDVFTYNAMLIIQGYEFSNVGERIETDDYIEDVYSFSKDGKTVVVVHEFQSDNGGWADVYYY